MPGRVIPSALYKCKALSEVAAWVEAVELDRTDVQILRALQENARQSYRELARRIGVSVPTVSARVANLEGLGILRGYHAAVDPERLSQVRVVLVVRCRPSKTDAVAAALAAAPEARWAVRTEDSRVFLEAVLASSRETGAFLEWVAALDGVLSCEHHLAKGGFKDDPRAMIPDGVSAAVACFECGTMIEGAPVRLKMDGRTHYLCCTSCERLYMERYARIKSGAGRPTRRTTGRAAPSRTGA